MLAARADGPSLHVKVEVRDGNVRHMWPGHTDTHTHTRCARRNNYVTCAIISILAQFNPLSQHLSVFVRFVPAVTLTCGILAAVRRFRNLTKGLEISSALSSGSYRKVKYKRMRVSRSGMLIVHNLLCTHGTTTVTLAAHARRGLINTSRIETSHT